MRDPCLPAPESPLTGHAAECIETAVIFRRFTASPNRRRQRARRLVLERVLGQWIGTAKARLWAIPNSIPRLLVGHTTADAIQVVLSEAVEEAAAELRPFDAEALKSRSIDYATLERDPDAE